MADIPTDPGAEWGRVVLFVGNECEHWSIAEFEAAAVFCRDHHIDTLCAKRADGTNKWYGDSAQLEAERAAVLGKGAGYLPFVYCYGPKFGTQQVRAECAVLAEIMGDNHYSVVADLEAEWDGQSQAADLFSATMRPVPGLLGLTSWADPAMQNFPTRQVAPCVNAWIPQDYSRFLVSCEQQQVNAGMSVRFAAIDITQEFGAHDPVADAATMRERGHRCLFIWEYAPAETDTTLLDKVVAAFRG